MQDLTMRMAKAEAKLDFLMRGRCPECYHVVQDFSSAVAVVPPHTCTTCCIQKMKTAAPVKTEAQLRNEARKLNICEEDDALSCDVWNGVQ